MIFVRLLIVVIINLLLGCASTPPTPVESGVRQVDQAIESAKTLPASSPAAPVILSALETCRANLPAYETKVRDLTSKLEKCTADNVSLSKAAGKGEGYDTIIWVVSAFAVGFFIKWILTKVFKVGA